MVWDKNKFLKGYWVKKWTRATEAQQPKPQPNLSHRPADGGISQSTPAPGHQARWPVLPALPTGGCWWCCGPGSKCCHFCFYWNSFSVLPFAPLAVLFCWAATTQCLRLSSLNNTSLLSTPGGQKSKIRGSAGLASESFDRESGSGFSLWLSHLLPVSLHIIFPLYFCVQIFPFCKDTSHIGLMHALMISF